MMAHYIPKSRIKRASGAGFTLIELLVVIIIVGILASVAVPIMRSAKIRAIATEAVAALGTIRNAARMYYIEYQAYPDVSGGWFSLPNNALRDYIKPGDLSGVYFGDYCYAVGVSFFNHPYVIQCASQGEGGTPAPKQGEVFGVEPWSTGEWGGVIIMDENGVIYSDVAELGYRDANDLLL